MNFSTIIIIKANTNMIKHSQRKYNGKMLSVYCVFKPFVLFLQLFFKFEMT